MSCDIATRGRIGKDGELRQTKDGQPMGISSMTVDLTAFGAAEEQNVWLSLIAFGDVGKRLAKVKRGDTASVHGKLTKKPYKREDGTAMDGFGLLVESLICNRPKTYKKRERKSEYTGGNDCAVARPELNDEIPF